MRQVNRVRRYRVCKGKEPGRSRRNKFRAKRDQHPTKAMFWCDNRCSDKALSFWQFASVVIKEGEVSYTANLCQQCYNERLTAKGLAPLKNWQWKAVVEKKAHRGRLWRMLGKTSTYKECGSIIPVRD